MRVHLSTPARFVASLVFLLSVAAVVVTTEMLVACGSGSKNGAGGGSPDANAPSVDSGGPETASPASDAGAIAVPPADASWMAAPDAGGCLGDDAGVFSLKSDSNPIQWVKASPNNVIGDYAGQGKYVAQVFYKVDATTGTATYGANLLGGFDELNVTMPLAALQATATACDTMTLTGGGWMASIQGGHLTGSNGTDSIDLQRVVQVIPTLGAQPPAGAVVLFDGTDLSKWGAIDCNGTKDWTVVAGPAQWNIVDGAIEIVPGTCSIISQETFGDATIHAEFRTIGTPTHSGLFPQAQYQTTILQDYGLFTGGVTGNYGNSPVPGNPAKGTAIDPQIHAGRPPLEWQTLDIEYKAPAFANGQETAKAVETVILNGVEIFDQLPMAPPGGSAARILPKASTGVKLPILLEYHGMPVQFRNIWVVPH
jgi:hypothetical protein